MVEARHRLDGSQQRWAGIFDAWRRNDALRAAGPPLLFGVRLWASVCLALYVAFWLELDNPFWAGTSAAIVCQPQLGASLRKGWFRMIGTVVGAVAIVVLTACFPQDRVAFLIGLALWGAVCAFVATLLRNFASYAAALAGYTAAIIAADTLGATGGPDGQVFMLAITRASEICIGIVCAGIVLAGTDLGGAQRRLAALFADLAAEIAGRFTGMLALAGPGLPETQAGPTRARPARHRARSGHRRGDRRILPTALSFADAADGRGRPVRRSGRLAHGRGAPRATAGRSALGTRRRPSCAACRRSCDRRRRRVRRPAGWPTPSACAGSVRRRCGR